MDLSCIILSGDLELYVLGMLPPEEAHQVTQLALLFPEVQEELDRISASLLQLDSVASLSPSPAVKTRLMEQIGRLSHNVSNGAAPVVPLQTGRNLVNEPETDIDTIVQTPVVPMRSEGKSNYWFSAAALIGVLLSLGAVIFLASKNRQFQSDITAMNQQMRTLNRNVVELQRDNLAAAQMVQMLQNEQFRKIRLTAVPGKPDALAQVLWNTQTYEVYVNDISLPRPPAGRQYQLWAIVDGKPVDAGLLQEAKNKVQQMKTFERADAFAITLEQEGGSPTPTMEAMYVMAKV